MTRTISGSGTTEIDIGVSDNPLSLTGTINVTTSDEYGIRTSPATSGIVINSGTVMSGGATNNAIQLGGTAFVLSSASLDNTGEI